EKICRVFIEKQVTVTGLMVMLMRVLKVKNGTEAVPPTRFAAIQFGVLQIGSSAKVIENPDIVMSDSEDSMVTYTAVSSPFRRLSDLRSPGVDGPPVMPEDPYAYVVAAFRPRHPPDYVQLRSRPSIFAASPTVDSHRDYDGDDEDESSDDEDDDVDIEGDKEEEEHPAPADSTVVALPAIDHAPSAKETEPFKTDESTATPPPHPAYWVTVRISIRDEPPTPFGSDTEVARLFAIPTPPPSPLSPLSSPLPQIPSTYTPNYYHYRYHLT
ncbi:hypothetical protein Tco_0759306, partial [Tanacetum coccineum]